jgi:bacterioferritin-associated ferredoxin
MWVCLCKGVTDRQIRAAIVAGARTPAEISVRCRAGSGCGGCVPELCRMLQDHLARQVFEEASAAGAQGLSRPERSDLVPA